MIDSRGHRCGQPDPVCGQPNSRGKVVRQRQLAVSADERTPGVDKSGDSHGPRSTWRRHDHRGGTGAMDGLDLTVG